MEDLGREGGVKCWTIYHRWQGHIRPALIQHGGRGQVKIHLYSTYGFSVRCYSWSPDISRANNAVRVFLQNVLILNSTSSLTKVKYSFLQYYEVMRHCTIMYIIRLPTVNCPFPAVLTVLCCILDFVIPFTKTSFYTIYRLSITCTHSITCTLLKPSYHISQPSISQPVFYWRPAMTCYEDETEHAPSFTFHLNH